MNVRQVIPPDAIPSVDDPEFVDVGEYEGHEDEQLVVVEDDDGPARAYPIRYLNYHEIVNDVLGFDPRERSPAAADDDEGRPVAVTWCPLCGSAVAYSRVVDGEVLEFGVSGKLADDDLVMYDQVSASEWKQSLGEAIAGPHEGTRLAAIPTAVTTLEAFRRDYADAVVLSRPGGQSEASGEGHDPEPIDYDDEPYREYFEMDGFGLAAHHDLGDGRDWERDDDISPKDVVLGVERDGEALGFPMDRVEAAGGAVTAPVGDGEVVVFTTPDGIFAYENPGLSFEATGEPGRFAADGTVWSGTTGQSEDGRRLGRVPARRLFAFAWQDDHGPDAFFDP